MQIQDKKVKAKRFRPFLALIRWWKKRRFYQVPHDDSVHGEESTKSGDPSHVEQRLPQNTYFTPQSRNKRPFVRSYSMDSFQDSIESMDSLFDSYWDKKDETSQVTTPMSNTGYKTDFLGEHVGFLCAQTQPREVEVVFSN